MFRKPLFVRSFSGCCIHCRRSLTFLNVLPMVNSMRVGSVCVFLLISFIANSSSGFYGNLPLSCVALHVSGAVNEQQKQ